MKNSVCFLKVIVVYLVSAYEASVQNLVQKGVHSIERSMFSPFDSYMDLAGKDIYIYIYIYGLQTVTIRNISSETQFIRNTSKVSEQHILPVRR